MDRIDKINQMIKREISLMLQQEFQDPRLTFVTITQVSVSRDLQHARVSFSFLGDDSLLPDVERKLAQSRGHIRKLLGQRISIRYTPQIDFVYDRSIVLTARIEQTLNELKLPGKSAPKPKGGS